VTLPVLLSIVVVLIVTTDTKVQKAAKKNFLQNKVN
jgi:hypothetical protein